MKTTGTIPPEILKQIKKIEITTKKLVTAAFSGKYTSVFKGQGIEFADVREYVPGDDIRTIDWNVTARSDRPFVKQFVEERELTIMFLVDASASGQFGSKNKLKCEVAAELCGLLAFAAISNNDKVGMIVFTDTVEKYIPPSKGSRHALRVVREILYFKPERKGTDLELAVAFAGRVLNRTAVTFILSDFLAPDIELSLKRLARRHDVIAVRLFDPREQEWPTQGLFELEDAETGAHRFVDCSDRRFRKKFTVEACTRTEALERMFSRASVDHIDVDITKSYVDPILRFFRLREHRR